MNKLTKVGCSALCGSLAAISAAHAGDLTVTGGADMTWVSKNGATTGNPLGIGSNFLVDGSVKLARIWGLSEALIGLTIVSIGTGTPELATALMAAYRKKSDLAIGNAIGSNLFNIMFVVGIAALVAPLDGKGIKFSDLFVMLALSILLLPTVITGRVIDRKEGFLFLSIYIGYLYFLWPD